MIKQQVKVDDKDVYIYDNIFSQQEINDIYLRIDRRPFLRCNIDEILSNNLHSDVKFSSEIGFKEDLSNILLSRYKKNIDLLADSDKIEIIRHYVNFSTFNTVDLIHEDCRIDQLNYYTILQYGNFVWDKNWHGETVFHNSDLDEISFTSTLKPGRVVLFDSSIPHSARPPSKLALYPRYTIATKFFIKNN